jgi:membrane protease YdiL (CAAX protease family)
VRWGIWDFVLAFAAGVGGSIVAAAFVVNASQSVQLVVLLVGQNVTIIAYLFWAARAKGLGSLRADFGFVVRPADISWFFWGVGIQLLALIPTALLVEVHGQTAKQDVVKIADKSHGVIIPFIVLGVAVLAPVTEELLFRGALLRSLLRRLTPDRAVFVTAVVFGLVHLLGDPSVGSLIALPVIMLLGVVSGYQAVRTGNLSRSVMLHMGFNALTIVLLFA